MTQGITAGFMSDDNKLVQRAFNEIDSARDRLEGLAAIVHEHSGSLGFIGKAVWAIIAFLLIAGLTQFANCNPIQMTGGNESAHYLKVDPNEFYPEGAENFITAIESEKSIARDAG
jgi:hypothetical protein